jgi:hypothetical protein
MTNKLFCALALACTMLSGFIANVHAQAIPYSVSVKRSTGNLPLLEGKTIKIEVPEEGGKILEQLIGMSFMENGYSITENSGEANVTLRFLGFFYINGHQFPMQSLFKDVNNLTVDYSDGKPRILEFSSKEPIMSGLGKFITTGDPLSMFIGATVTIFANSIAPLVSSSSGGMNPCNECSEKYSVGFGLALIAKTDDSRATSLIRIDTKSNDIPVLDLFEHTFDETFKPYGSNAPRIRFPKPAETPETAPQVASGEAGK